MIRVAESEGAWVVCVEPESERDARAMRRYAERGGSLVIRHDGSVGWLPPETSRALVEASGRRRHAPAMPSEEDREANDGYIIVPDDDPPIRRTRR